MGRNVTLPPWFPFSWELFENIMPSNAIPIRAKEHVAPLVVCSHSMSETLILIPSTKFVFVLVIPASGDRERRMRSSSSSFAK